jgi:hypothetical protein
VCRAGLTWFAVAALGVSCSAADEPASAPPPDLGLGHIHGLGVNPADGELYAASHHGVFVVADGEAERRGPLIQDTMGFTVAGSDWFLGSGHPDIRNDPILEDDMTPLLGLIESTDRASSWEGLSLQGEVDFHALVYAHDRAYGADATSARFLVSDDLESWETRSEIDLWSFAVAPDDPERIVGVADTDVVSSGDGGRTWAPVAGTPALRFVSWHAEAGLWAVADDGTVYRSGDGGTTWDERGNVEGEAAGILADSSGLYVATSEAILSSTDQGASWQLVYDIM